MQSHHWLPLSNNVTTSSRSSSIHEDNFFTSKEDCHLKSEKVYDEWEQVIKSMIKIDGTDQKTAKMFTQADSVSKNTRSALEKTNKALDQLLDKKQSILAAMKSFNEIHALLDLNNIAIHHWHTSTTADDK